MKWMYFIILSDRKKNAIQKRAKIKANGLFEMVFQRNQRTEICWLDFFTLFFHICHEISLFIAVHFSHEAWLYFFFVSFCLSFHYRNALFFTLLTHNPIHLQSVDSNEIFHLCIHLLYCSYSWWFKWIDQKVINFLGF